MKLDRFNNAKRNSIWGIINKIVLLVFPFIVRAFIIKKLGVEYLGLNGLFTSVLSILNLTELGIGSAIVYSMYKPLAEEDTEKICSLMNLYKTLYRYIGMLVLIVGLCIMPFINHLISGDVPTTINIYVLYLIYLLNSVVSYWLFAYKNCLLQVYQRTDIQSKIILVLHSMMYILQIVILIIFHNYYIYIIILPLFSIIQNIVTALVVTHMYPQYCCNGIISKEEKNDIKKRVMGLMFTKIAAASRNSFDCIVVSALLGLNVVAIYSNYYYISTSLSALLVILVNSMSAGIGNSLVTESKQKNINDINKISFIYISISGFCFVLLLVLYQPFMKLWVGKELLFSDSIMIYFSIYFLVEKSLNVVGQYYDASGLWWKGKWKGLIESLANLVLNFVLCYFFGVKGIVFATIITILFIGFPLTSYYLYKYSLNISSKNYIISEYKYLLFFIVSGLLIYLGCGKIIIDGLSTIIMMVLRAFISIVFIAILYLIVFSRTQIFKDSLDWMLIHLKLKKINKKGEML